MTRLRFGYGRGQCARGASRLEANLAVHSIAERFIRRLSTAAQADRFAAREIESVAVHVVNCEVPFDTNRAVVADSDFCWHFSHRNRSELRARHEAVQGPAYNERHHMIHLSSDTGELFANSYQFAQRQVRKLIEKHPMLYPLHTKDGEWKHEGQVWTHWSDGFLPGMMWIFYRHAEPGSADAKFWFENAVRYTEPIEPRKKDRDAHDLGFLFLSTYYRWNRLHPDPAHARSDDRGGPHAGDAL